MPSGVLVAAGREGVHRSTDGGRTWEEVLPKPERDECNDFLQFTFAILSTRGTALVGSLSETTGGCKTYFSIYQSSDAIDWSRIPTYFFDSQAILPISADTLIYGGKGINYYFNVHEHNPGQISSKFVTEFGSDVTDLILDPGGDVYAATGPPVYGFRRGNGVYRSADRGETWQQVNVGLTDTTMADLEVYPNGTLLAATYYGGVHRSTDGGDTWHAVNEGLPSLRVTALAVTPEGTVYAGTDRGIYRSAQPIATGTDETPPLPEHFHLGANYPNPFNPQTTIPFELAGATPVRLAVYDVLGREVARLVDGPMPAGTHAVTFDASSLPSGVYIYRLEAGSFVKTRRMTLVK